jgi:hypothetical protein
MLLIEACGNSVRLRHEASIAAICGTGNSAGCML